MAHALTLVPASSESVAICRSKVGDLHDPTSVTTVPATDLRETVDAVWRMEAAKIVATLTRVVGDVGLAEDLAQEALVDALTQWPRPVCAQRRRMVDNGCQA